MTQDRYMCKVVTQSEQLKDVTFFAMPAFSRGLRSFAPQACSVCPRCLCFSTSAVSQSGHNRWSKIKHDKGQVDAKKNAARSLFARDIALASKRKCVAFYFRRNAKHRYSLWRRSKHESQISNRTTNSEERYLMGYKPSN